jgi:chromosome segregation ATPase
MNKVHTDATKGDFMNRTYLRFLFFGFLTTLSTQVFAQALVEKDWLHDKRMHALVGTMSCVASTAQSESSLQVTTEIILPEGDEKVPLIIIKTKGLKGSIPRAHIRPDAKTQYPMLLLKSDPATDEDTFVLSPMRIPETLDIIAAKNTLDVYFGEGPTAILARISLKGSSKIINRTAICRQSKTLLKQRLFAELKKDPQLATPLAGTVQDLMISYQKTLDAINASEKIQAQLVAHNQVGQSLLSQEKQANQSVAIAEKAVLDTQNQIVVLQQKVSNLKSALVQAQIDLPQLQADRPIAQKELTSAQNALGGVESEVRRLQAEVDRAQSRENQILLAINSYESEASNLQNEIYRQQSEADRLRRDQNSRYSQINSLQTTKNQLDQNYKMFDVNRRTEQLLYNNSTYMNQYNSLPGLNNRRNQLNNEIPAASNLVKELNRAVNDCLAGPGHLTPGGMVPPECLAEKARLNTAQKDLSNKQNELNNVNRQISDTNNSIANYQTQARQQAINEREHLASEINLTQQRINQIQSDINTVDRQINNILQVTIPQLQNDLYSAKSNLASSQNSLAQASAHVRRTRTNLVNYKNSIGYDKLVLNAKNAQSRLSLIDQKIAQAQLTLSKGPGQISANEAEIINQQNLLVQKEAVASQTQTHLKNIQSSLSKHQLEEQEIQKQLAIHLNELLVVKRTTQGLSKGLYGF